MSHDFVTAPVVLRAGGDFARLMPRYALGAVVLVAAISVVAFVDEPPKPEERVVAASTFGFVLAVAIFLFVYVRRAARRSTLTMRRDGLAFVRAFRDNQRISLEGVVAAHVLTTKQSAGGALAASVGAGVGGALGGAVAGGLAGKPVPERPLRLILWMSDGGSRAARLVYFGNEAPAVIVACLTNAGIAATSGDRAGYLLAKRGAKNMALNAKKGVAG